ncbi:MAG TPA: hypothetical protein DDY49_13985, partial [Paenibacillaceae bacterium]|nr:hypothetical protein [Paenibacillaceae bacterium]
MNLVLWSFATILSLVFSIRILILWTIKRKPQYMAWFIGFFFYFFSALGSTLSYITGWDPTLYRIWYVAAASLVGFLGAGQLYFTVKPKWAHVFLGIIIIITIAMFIKVFNSPLNMDLLSQKGEIGGAALPGDARIYSPMITIPGSLALIIGSIYTFIRRKSKAGLWIGLGSLILATGGQITRLGFTEILPLTNSLGITLVFYGFALTTRRKTI